jgi:thiol-disulfide isomerase/thioredoxin
MARGFYETLNRLLTPYYSYILAIVLLGVFSYISYYLYMEYKTREEKIKDAKDVANSSGGAKIEVLIRLFYTDWCPYSAKALPEWNKFKDRYNGEIYNEKKIQIVQLDCSNENDSNVKKIIDENNIDSYPTVKMYKNDEIIDFDAKISYDNLEQFIETML